MNKTEIKKSNTRKIVDMLIKEYNIHTIERDNQYIRFWMGDGWVQGSLDTRDFNVDLVDLNDEYNKPIGLSGVENNINKKVRELVAS
jgi:hypothetical protein